MSIQKQKLQALAHRIYKQLISLSQISNCKKNYAQKINYQISSLFAFISQYPTISSRDLTNIFDPLSIKLLLQNKKYFTVEDLCNYLGVSNKHSSYNKATISSHAPLQVDSRYELEQIISREVEAMENIRESLKSLPSEQIFNEIDFFNNGYIDADSLLEFVSHFKIQNNSPVVSGQKIDDKYLLLRCQEIIRYLKGSATAEKIFQVDFIQMLTDMNIVQNKNPNNPQQSRQMGNNSLSLSRSIGHIARVAEIQTIHSIKRKRNFDHHFDQSNLVNFLSVNGSRSNKPETENQSINQTQPKLTHEQRLNIHKTLNKNLDNQNYEQKICSNHWRNVKYLQKLKLETNFSHFNQKKLVPNKDMEQIRELNIHSQSSIQIKRAKQKFSNSFFPLKGQPIQINKSEILYQLRYLAQIYDKHKKQVEVFLTQNQCFTIINGFNVIDLQDRGFVSYRQLKQFLFQIQLNLNQKKIHNLFIALCKKNCNYEPNTNSILNIENQVIFYHSFAIKIFKIKQIENLFKKCRNRKPLLFQEWSEQQKKNYCRFIRNIITIFFDMNTAKKMLIKMFKLHDNKQEQEITISGKIIQKMKSRMYQLFEQNEIHHEKFKQMLGKSSQTLVGQLYGNQVILQSENFLKFLVEVI